MQTMNLFYRSVKWRFQNPVTIIMTLIQPLIWLLLFSTLFGGEKAGGNYTAFILPGILIMGVMSGSGISGIANYSLKAGGSYYRIVISPVKRSAIVAAHILDAAVVAFIQTSVLLGLAFLMSVRIASGADGFLLMLLLLFFTSAFAAALSYALSLVIPDENAFIALVNTLTLPLFFVSSALIPYEQLQGGFRAAAGLNPFTPVIQGLRMLILEERINWPELLTAGTVVLVLAAASFGLAVHMLNRDSRHPYLSY